MSENEPPKVDLKHLINNLTAKVNAQVVEPSMIPGIHFQQTITPPPTFEPPYHIVYVEDTETENRGRAIYNVESNTLTFYMPHGYSFVNEPNHEYITKQIATNRHVFSIARLGELAFDPSKMVTCEYYTTGRDAIEDMGYTESDHFPYNKAFSEPSCSHPDVEPGTGCISQQCQALCRMFKPEKPKTILAYQMTDSSVIKLNVQRIHEGALRAYVTIGESTNKKDLQGNPISSLNSLESLYSNRAEVLADFDLTKVTNKLVECELPVESETEVQIKYYDYALAK